MGRSQRAPPTKNKWWGSLRRPTLRCGKRANRSGYALVLFVMIFFGLIGLAALVIDMGFARLAQRQMQTAVDSAALEGLRWRDYSANPPTGQSSDHYRRQQASSMAANVFDDDLNPTNGDPSNFGAGPVVQFQGEMRRSRRLPSN